MVLRELKFQVKLHGNGNILEQLFVTDDSTKISGWKKAINVLELLVVTFAANCEHSKINLILVSSFPKI